MDRILNAIKCAICREVLESPVILPCNDTICKKHVSNQTSDLIKCEKCGVEHQIPTNGFQLNNTLQEIIEIVNVDLGNVHKEAKKSCELVEEALIEQELLLKDPYFYTHERISELKNSVQLKGEELKLIIDQEIRKLLDRLEEYGRQSKEYLSSNEFKVESQKFEKELKISQSNLNLWRESLNKIKFEEEKWKSIREESNLKLKCINEESAKFKKKLLLNKFVENQKHVNWFKSIKSLHFVLDNKDFPESTIITEKLSQNFEELLKKKDLNGQKWSLLYQGSRDGFRASDFHTRCDGKPNTLTIVKSTSENIFGGFTSLDWKSSIIGLKERNSDAFIYSLVNKENRRLIFEPSFFNTIFSKKNLGPVFGEVDILISNCSNTNTDSYSNLGREYTHPEYKFGSERAKTILAGTEYFQVQEIEVFQLQ